MALKLIHTADWHLGQAFFGYDWEAEHEAFLGFLTNLLVEREADVLPPPDGILILLLFLLGFCGFTPLGYNDDDYIASFRSAYGSVRSI